MERQKIGAWGENLACEFLASKGYQIIKKNLQLGNQELDIVCSFRAKIIVFEVKTKFFSVLCRPEDMVGRSKLRNLKIAGYKLARLLKINTERLQFDLLAMEINRVAKSVKIRHYKDII